MARKRWKVVRGALYYKSVPKRYRWFGGKRYTLRAARYSKAEAQAVARAAREEGFYARVVRVSNPGDLRPEYHVFVRRR